MFQISTLPKACHSERSEESALVRFGPDLQILRCAQDESDFHPLGWAKSTWDLPTVQRADPPLQSPTFDS